MVNRNTCNRKVLEQKKRSEGYRYSSSGIEKSTILWKMRKAEVDVAEDVKEILPQKMFCYYTSFLFTKDVSLYD